MTNTVEELLQKENIPYTVSGKDYVIRCLNPEHEDHNPSFRIDKITGISHCYSCGFKVNIFKHFGILTISNNIKVQKLKEKLGKIKTSLFGIEKPAGLVDFGKSYRGVSLATLQKFGACQTQLVPELTDRIMFPIQDISGKVLAYVCRHLYSNENPKYINYPTGAAMPLFPPKPLEYGHSSLILVEGIFDMLNLVDKGLNNVACCFGTNVIKSNLKEKLTPYKISGVRKIYIMFDGDDAGKKAAAELLPMLEELDFYAEIIPLAEDTDPGTLSSEDIESLRVYTK